MDVASAATGCKTRTRTTSMSRCPEKTKWLFPSCLASWCVSALPSSTPVFAPFKLCQLPRSVAFLHLGIFDSLALPRNSTSRETLDTNLFGRRGRAQHDGSPSCFAVVRVSLAGEAASSRAESW